MSAGEHRVGLVASDLGSELEGLSERCHVWAVRMPANEAVAERIRVQRGEHSHDPPLNVVEIFGTQPTERIREGFAALGFRRLEPSPTGFVAFRDEL